MVEFTSLKFRWLKLSDKDQNHATFYKPNWELSELLTTKCILELNLEESVIHELFEEFGGSACYRRAMKALFMKPIHSIEKNYYF
jgi:hypothetical protein